MVEWLALGFSAVAIGVSVASVWYVRRQAQATEDLSEIERQRERARQRPKVEPSFSEWLKESITVTFVLENKGTRTIDRVLVKVLSGDDEARLIGFGDDTDLADRKRAFGPLRPGVPVETTFILADADTLDEDAVDLLMTLTVGDDQWDERIEAKLPPYSPRAYFA